MKVMRYRSESGVKTALLVKEGRKYLQILLLDYPMRIRRVPHIEARYMTEMDYPVNRAKRMYRDFARAHYEGLRNVPKSVRAALR